MQWKSQSIKFFCDYMKKNENEINQLKKPVNQLPMSASGR